MSTTPTTIDLFSLLPALYRLRDAQLAASQTLLTPAEAAELQALQALTPPRPPDEQGRLDQLTAKASRGPLQSLLALVAEQLAVIADNIEQLYDDQFIETCAPWVIPYLGELIGYQAVNGIAAAVASPRAEVANTISLRRRKGTVLVMEQLARDVTGWPAHAVESFRILGDTQYLNHLRGRRFYAPDVRRLAAGPPVDSAFDRTAHTVDVRRIAVGRGRYNIPNIGIFLWSLGAHGVTMGPATPVQADAECFRFSSLGCDSPLFNNPTSQGARIAAPAEPVNVPARLRRRVLCDDLRRGAGAAYYGEALSLALYIDGTLLDPYQVQVCDLSGPDGSWINKPPAGSLYAASIDPELGRIALPPSPPGSPAPRLRATYYYGANGDLGGGEYPRSSSFTVQDEARVLPFPDTASTPRYSTLQDALAFAVGELAVNGQIAVEISGSNTLPTTGSQPLDLAIHLPEGTSIELRAADGARPTLVLSGEIAVTGAPSSAMILSGLMISSAIPPGMPAPIALVHAPAQSPDGSDSRLSRLTLNDCTLVPGWALQPDSSPRYGSLPALVAQAAGLEVVVSRSIVGALRIDELATASISDSVVDATDRTGVAYSAADGLGAGGALTLLGCTVIGKVHATLLEQVSDSILWAGLAAGDAWTAPLRSDRKQAGCVRFSYLPMGSVTPRRYECVEHAAGSPQPLFDSLRYGDPAYAKLLPATDDAIRRGADDGGEMGAFHFILAPLREADLRVRIGEYLPVGLEFGIIFEN